MSAKKAAVALLELDTNLVAFAATLAPNGYDAEKKNKVAAFVRENVMGTWTLTLAARAAGQAEDQVIGALLELEPLRCGTQGYGRAMAKVLFDNQTKETK